MNLRTYLEAARVKPSSTSEGRIDPSVPYPEQEGDAELDLAAKKKKHRKKKKDKMDPTRFNRLKNRSDYYSEPFDSITKPDRKQAEVL